MNVLNQTPRKSSRTPFTQPIATFVLCYRCVTPFPSLLVRVRLPFLASLTLVSFCAARARHRHSFPRSRPLRTRRLLHPLLSFLFVQTFPQRTCSLLMQPNLQEGAAVGYQSAV